MSQNSFPALVLSLQDNTMRADISDLTWDDLPAGDVLVEVEYSTINYKDALAVTGKGKIIRNFPFVPGVDLVGVVVESGDARLAAGTRVVSTGWGVGEKHFGGFARYARLKSEWLLPLPASLDAKSAMVIGTAGVTAGQCVFALRDGGLESGQAVVVSGSSGGVGSFAVRLLASLGMEVSAISRPEAADYLGQLGAHHILDRAEYQGDARPLEKAHWQGAVDTVGSKVLAKILAECDYGATVAMCGLAAGIDLPATVMPFILRGVSLQGIESVYAPLALRERVWQFLSEQLTQPMLDSICADVIGLSEVPKYCDELLRGQHQGRLVVDVRA